MKRYRQFQPVVISDFEAKKWLHPVHNHNHYELIYIKHGQGKHHINQQAISYGEGDLFLLGPEEEHYFDIELPTRFVYLKFTDLYMRQQGGEDLHIQQLEYLLKSREARLSKFCLTDSDKQITAQIFNLISILKTNGILNENLVWLQVMALAEILKRNLHEGGHHPPSDKNMEAVFTYIHEHIYTPPKLTATVMAAHFNTTQDYIGPYFKRNAGVTLRDYIKNHRKTLISKRLQSGKYTLKQIANEFGLTDESHVSKLIK